jgi:outer membrane protein assembly factor BamD (BamD/ComL family)
MNRFYMEAAYKYAQMLLLMKQDALAVKAYERALQAKLKDYEKRQIQGELAELLIKLAEADPQGRATYLPRIEKIINELMWKQDLWFGKSIAMMAHMKMMKGETESAMKLIDDYRSQLEDMDRVLREDSEKEGVDFIKLSPMAQVRYMIGVMLQTEAEKLTAANGDREKTIAMLAGVRKADGRRDTDNSALGNFYSVFINYPSCQWAPDAGRRARRVEDILRGFGGKITTQVTDEQWAKVMSKQFTEARALTSQGQYDAALECFYSVLNAFPEGEMSIDALGETIKCYVEQNDTNVAAIYAPMLAGYLAERFCMNTNLAGKAGDQVVRVAEMFGEHGNPAARDALYAQFFALYGKHAMAASMQYRFGEREMRRENYPGALNYFKQVAEKYAHLPLGLDALYRVAFCYGKMDDATNEIASLEVFVAGLEKQGKSGSILVLEARNRIAYANWKMGKERLLLALKQFNDIIAMLNVPNPPFSNGEDDQKRAQDILETAMFFKASGFASLTEPAERVKDFRQAALRGYADLVKRFPRSQHAPRALAQTAALLLADGQADKAADAIRRLEKEYADTSEAKNATYTMGKSLLDLGFREQAVKYFRRMFEEGGNFNDGQILSAASELMKAKQYDIALGGYERVIGSASTNRVLHELSLLGKGKCQVELGRYQDAVVSLVSFTNSYPHTMNIIESSMYLGRAYGELASAEPDRQKRIQTFNLGVRALKDAMRYERTPGGKARLAFEAGRMNERQAEAETKHGTADQAKACQGSAVAAYRTLGLTFNAAEPGVAEWMRKANVQCVPLLMKLGKEKDALEICDAHLKAWPDSPSAEDMRRMRNEVRVILVTRGELSGGTPEKEPEKTPEAAPATDAPAAQQPVGGVATNAPAAGSGSAPEAK